jgi:predicted membrane channel-forming protein YqfA (hemolysin III family)
MARGGALIFFILYVILGLYLINVAINFINIPEFLLKIDKWILFLGGVFLIFGGINFLRVNRYTAIRTRR